MTRSQTFYARYAWGLLAYTILVILWGAFVRASGSGDGCGSHWPECNGVVVPLDAEFKTWVEYSHRVSSALVGLLVLPLLWGAFRLFPRGAGVRAAAAVAVIFTITEGLIGMILVRRGLVADNDSIERALWLAIHLANTFILLGGMTLTAWRASGGPPLRLKGQGSLAGALLVALGGMLLLGVSGAVTALGDTIRPMTSSVATVQAGLQPTAHVLDRLRIIHPTLAIAVGLYILLMVGLVRYLRPSESVHRWGNAVVAILVANMLAGFVNVLLKAPVWMQLMHLLLADALWITIIILCAAALAVGVPKVEFATAAGGEPARATWRDYVALTKPKVISLLLFTTVTAMFAAAKGWPGFGLLLAVMIGGYMAAGAANTLNMVVERDLDERMGRTARRPTVTNAIPPQTALMFGFALALASFTILWLAANLLAAMLAFAGLTFYVIIYTLLLKRRTWQNIVIGGAAGSFPPLVGWSAVTNDLSPLAWSLFAIIFFWTPVHFWALALMIKDDYAKAGVPMLPVVRGERYTVNQIGLYGIITAVVCVVPFAVHEVGWVYFGAATVLNLLLLVKCFQLYRRIERPASVALYKYSMLYLALLFVAVAVDKAVLV